MTISPELLDFALRGDQQAFADLVEPHRKELIVHCYRMLGSLFEAEDAVQEAFLRAWQKLKTYEARAPFRAWLYKIATNLCLDLLKKERRRGLPVDVYPASNPDDPFAPPSDEFPWLEPFPDAWLEGLPPTPETRFQQTESITLAFIAAIQALTPQQRASLILKDVLEWTTREISELLEVSETAANSLLFRARKTMEQRYGNVGGEHISPSPDAPQVQHLLERYVRAWETSNVDELVGLLRDDAILTMPPSPSWVRGAQAIRQALALNLIHADMSDEWRLVPVRANGGPAYAFYHHENDGQFVPFGIHLLTITAGQISNITHFFSPQLVARFTA